MASPRVIASRPLRSTDFPQLLESFVVAGVVSVLGIRALLALTGFPRLGGGGLHIAHMLWGGALMVAALVLLIAFLDRRVQHVAVIVAGLGFGTFIDEIGKFVTADNDYFFRPAVALIYVAFVALFLVARTLAGSHALSQPEALANALDLVAGTLGRPLEPEDRERIRGLLAQARPTERLVADLEGFLDRADMDVRPPDLGDVIAARARALYDRWVLDPRFARLLTAGVLVYTAVAILASAIVIAAAGGRGGAPASAATPSVATLAQALSSFAGAALVVRGALLLRASRASAYRWFLRGLLVWILVTQVFVFYESQLAGMAGLTVDLAAYSLLRYALAREHPGLAATAAAARSDVESFAARRSP